MEIPLVGSQGTDKSGIMAEGEEALANSIGGEFVQALTTSPFVLPYEAAAGGDKSGLQVARYVFTGTPSGATNVEHPAVRHFFRVDNQTDQPVTVLVVSQTGVLIPAGHRRDCYCNGTDVVDASPTTDFMSYTPGKPAVSLHILRLLFKTRHFFPIDFAESIVEARIASVATATFDVQKNGGSIGSLVFSTSTTGVFTIASAQTFTETDILSIVAPGSQDANLEDISMTLVANKG